MNTTASRNPTGALPGWEDMTDLDRGAALLHVWKRDWEGESYAVEEYLCTYFESPVLVALGPREASAHAAKVCGSHRQMLNHVGEVEHDRLYDLALAAERRQSR